MERDLVVSPFGTQAWTGVLIIAFSNAWGICGSERIQGAIVEPDPIGKQQCSQTLV